MNSQKNTKYIESTSESLTEKSLVEKSVRL